MAAHARAPVAAFSCPECRAAFPHAYQLTDHLREHALLQQQVQLQEQVARQMEEQMLLQQQLEEQFMIQQAYITQTAFGASLGLGWGAMAPVAPTPIRCVCLECGREFLQRSALRQHMKEHETKHNKESPRRIRNQCPADFSNPWNLARHYKEHLRHLCVLSLSDLRCHVCNENFRSDEVELRRHRALHKDVRFCKCRCGATFRSGWDWEQHVITCTTPPAA
ncbi:zinc finger protein 668-like [Thrips palmi]|uniref:Zinc finger protein 668-like n=1 Tax=Thrips palmi TaxID=161013 RepID=A0A6P8Z5C6_THRPL|nr:zinc finger protein 668-like [Thrips palmi]